MSFLTFTESGEILLAKEAEDYDVVKKMKKSTSKKGFEDFCKYVYHTYSLVHPLSSLLPEQRMRRVSTEYLSDAKYWEIEKSNKTASAFIDQFIQDSYSRNERFYFMLSKDMEHFRKYLSEIPFTKKQKISKEVDITFEYNGEDVTKGVFVSTIIEIDNSKEKIDALQKANNLLKLEKDLRKQIMEEKVEAKKSTGRIFDNRQHRPKI